MELVEVEFHLHLEMKLNFPRVRTPNGWITFGFHEDLDEAVMIAMDGMLDLLKEQHGLERNQAMARASLAVDLRVTQIVNGTKGAHTILSDLALAGIYKK